VGGWSYFIGKVLGGIRNVFLPSYPQDLSCLNLECRGIFKTHKRPVQKKKNFIGEFFDIIDHIPKTFVRETISS